MFTGLDARVLDALPAFTSTDWRTAGAVAALAAFTVDEARERLRILRDAGLVARTTNDYPIRYSRAPVFG